MNYVGADSPRVCREMDSLGGFVLFLKIIVNHKMSACLSGVAQS